MMHDIKIADRVFVLPSEYNWDAINGPALVIAVGERDVEVEMQNQNWVGWFAIERILTEPLPPDTA